MPHHMRHNYSYYDFICDINNKQSFLKSYFLFFYNIVVAKCQLKN
jgi:hypothetical protein